MSYHRVIWVIGLGVLFGRAWGQKLFTLPIPERDYLSALFEKPGPPVYLRANAIRDVRLVASIKRGGARRDFYILVDQSSRELEMLRHVRRARVRIANGRIRKRLEAQGLSGSFVFIREVTYDSWWAGPLIWSPKAFRSSTSLITENGNGPGENDAANLRVFRECFKLAK
jgi:hypothetical protein